MTSRALDRWRADRTAALARLERIHSAMTGGLAGRPREVTELNHALFLRLAAETQGFCRDLHDEAIDAVCTEQQVPSTELRAAFRTVSTTGRKWDSGNAGPGNLGHDWARLGMTLWADLTAAHPGPRGAISWNTTLGWLNTARHGIAHNDPVKIADAHATHPLTLGTFRTMRTRLGAFASAVDRATGACLLTATQVAPW